jgi:5-formyltetrahydrofolate cyclo-ligase
VKDKQAYREHAWTLLERAGASGFPGARGRIPNFVGAEAAARRLTETEQWAAALVVKANPDAPQLPVRALALEDGKRLYMAVPRLREAKPFLLIDSKASGISPRKAASIRGASSIGQPVALSKMRPVDLVVCGSVAVNHKGVRIGKGGGYSDIELALLTEAGLVTDATTVVTTVHPLQILDEALPEATHDFRVDLIVTPDEVLRPSRRSRRRPPGIVWAELSQAKIEEIPLLRRMASRRPGRRTAPPPRDSHLSPPTAGRSTG